MSIEWTNTDILPGIVTPDEGFEDDYGTGLDPQNHGIFVSSGDADGALVEGTLDDLIAWTERLLDALRETKAGVE